VYVADREERFDVIADVVLAATQRPDALVIDLGCGPGSLSARLGERMPHAQIIGVDADPLLLGLATAGYADRHGLTFVSADLRKAGWADALHLERGADAVVSTTALHWLTRDELAALYHDVATMLAPSGVFVDGDNFATRSATLDVIANAVRAGRAERVGRAGEDWSQWWDSVGQAPELAALAGERGARPIDHSVPDEATLDDHTELLRAAGFAEVGTVWQHGDDRVLVGVRGNRRAAFG